MARRNRYLDIDVLTAARQRVRDIFDRFDTVAVMFSGGKDSETCLHLVHEEAKRRGQKQVNVVFRDEELIPDFVIARVNKYRLEPWVRMFWFAVPLLGTKAILGEVVDCVFWQPGRPWIRQKPEWSITLPDDSRVFHQSSMDLWVADFCGFRGLTCHVTGLRATESLTRLQGIRRSLKDTHIAGIDGVKRVKIGRPVYDWSENDIIKYLHEEGDGWNELYERQFFAGVPLRVSTPLHPEAVRTTPQLRSVDPEFFGRLVEVYPELRLQERYGADIAEQVVLELRDDMTLLEIRDIVRRELTGEKLQQALFRLRQFESYHRYAEKAYPLSELVKSFRRGIVNRQIKALRKTEQAALERKAGKNGRS